jgi:two-component sensor histidine kinase
LPAATAVTLGVLVNELVSNACKYAYGKEESGEVRIRFELEGTDGYHLRVEDDGVGMEDDAKPQGTGLGSQIITAMTRSLGAKHSFSTTGKGLQVNIYRAPASDQPIDLSGAPVTLPAVSAAPTGLGMNT